MKVIVVGGTGTIGSAIVDQISARHELIIAHRHSDFSVDCSSVDSIKKMYQSVGPFDALINAAGSTPFKAIGEIAETDYRSAIDHKLMAQINLVLLGLSLMNDHGSFTLTSGVLNHDPIVTGSAAAMVNGGIEGFVASAAIEMPRGIRLNVVSPTVVTEAMPKYGDYFRGFTSVPAAKVALAYAKSMEGKLNGKIFKVFS